MKSCELCMIILIVTTPLLINTKTTQKRTYSKQRVVVISFDGFRYDYIKRDNLEAFKKFARYGASASSLKPVFTTKTFPNHFTIATGLYEETHGIVGNQFYDPVFKDTFHKSNDAKWWTGAKPIWMLNEERIIEGTNKTGKSATIFWPGSESSYGGKYPSYTYKEYNASYSTKNRFDEIVKLMLNDDDLNLVMCYIEEPDNTAHNHGPDSDVTKAMLKQLNDEFDYFIRKMDRANLLDTVNIIVVSDHGFLPIPRQNVKYLSDYLNNTSDFHLDSHGVLLHVRPLEGKKEEVYKALKKIEHLNVYYKKDIPERWHYKNNRRIPEIIALSDPTYYFALNNGTWIPHGDHGYDNDMKEMHGIFIARGPAFKKNLKIGEVQNIDICALLCHVLDIEPHPNNGSLARIDHIVQEKNLFSVIMKNPALIIALLSICGIFVLIVILGCTISCYRNFVESSKYRRLHEDNVPLAQWTDDPDEITEFQLRR